MEGVDLTKAMLNKGKQMASVAASAANGNGGKKRRKGTDLKPIVTNDANPPATGDPTESYVFGFPTCLGNVLTTWQNGRCPCCKPQSHRSSGITIAVHLVGR